MANVGTSLKNWSTTEASNQPDGSDSATIAGDLRAIQAGVRHLRSNDTIASASTCDLGSKDAEYLSISGTTTITALGTVSAGIVKRVVFEGALTLTHNASLILPGAANITTAAGDAAEFVSLGGGNWRCTQYQKASGLSIVPVSDGDKGDITVSSSGATWTIDSGVVTASKLGSGAVEGAITASLGGFRNKIIGGDFTTNPWQRGTSFTSATTPANSDDTYLADRWYLLSDGNDIVDVTRSTDAPTGALYSIALDVETANKKFGIAQIVEQVNAIPLIGGTCSLSFKAKVTGSSISNVKAAVVAWSGTADTVTSDIISAWNTDGTTPTLIANATFENTPENLSVTSSWATYKIENISIDTASTKNLIVFIWCDDLTTTLGDFLYVTQVQLEAGSVATPFETRSVGQELALCQRYYYRTDAQNGLRFSTGLAANTTVADFVLRPPVIMRSSPTALEQTGTAADYNILYQATNANCSSVPIFQTGSIESLGFRFTVASGLTAGDSVIARSTGNGYLGWSAEL